jgi:hypothetical protein
MDKFAGFVKNMPDPKREIKVAVVDDGVDKLQGSFGDSIITGVSFYTSQRGFGTWPHYFSSSGHGTLMAQLVRRICPKAKLYIARLDEGINGEPTIESAIKVRCDWILHSTCSYQLANLPIFPGNFLGNYDGSGHHIDELDVFRVGS